MCRIISQVCFLGFRPQRERPKPCAGCLVFEYGIDDPWWGLWTLPLGLETFYPVQIFISHALAPIYLINEPKRHRPVRHSGLMCLELDLFSHAYRQNIKKLIKEIYNVIKKMRKSQKKSTKNVLIKKKIINYDFKKEIRGGSVRAAYVQIQI